MKVNNQIVFNNLIWRFAERVGAKGVTLFVSIILARLLSPEAYGQVALVSIFLTILGVFVDSGLGSALIQKKNADEDDFSTVFCFNVIWCIVLYTLLWICAPWIAAFYNDQGLTSLTRVAGLTVVISGVKNVQLAYVSKNMQFKKFFAATIGGTIFSGILGIMMAYYGYGAWALVIQSVSNTAIDTLILWLTVKWRPQGKFKMERLKALFSYGWKLLASAIIDTVFRNLRGLIIGRMYSAVDLAYFNKAKGWPELIVTNINSSIDSVLLPTMSSEQDDKARIKQMTRRAISVSTYTMAPMMIGLFCVAPELIKLILTEKWLPSVPYMRIFCITYMFYPIHTANLNAIKAMGRSDLFLKLEIIKKMIGLGLLLITMWYSPLVMAYSLILSSFTSQIINTWPNKKLLNYSYIEQMKDILPNILQAVVMGIGVCLVPLLNLPTLVTLVIQIFVGVVIYVTESVILRNENFIYLWRIIKPIIQRKLKRKK